MSRDAGNFNIPGRDGSCSRFINPVVVDREFSLSSQYIPQCQERHESGLVKDMYKYIEVKGNSFVLSLDNHVEVTEALTAFCKEKGILSGTVSGIGAISEATFRFLDPAIKQYVDRTFREQMEVTNLTGNISQKNGEVYLHLHLTASRRDYTCIGGHLLSARINGACELFVESFPGTYTGRRPDAETGLNLYEFK